MNKTLGIFLASVCFVTTAVAQTPKQDEYLRLAQDTLFDPITPSELEAAFVSDAGVASLREVFEQSMRGGLWAGTGLVTPELGGEAMLTDRTIVLVEYPDPIHPLIRRVHKLRGDPQGLLDFLSGSSDGQRILKETGGLHALLYQMTTAERSAPQSELLNRVVDAAVEIHFKTWTADPIVQRMIIEQNTWQGRYIGFWHIHPPRAKKDGFSVGIEPSMSDLEMADELGQFLTIVFQPGGFDVYDLSRRGEASSLAKTRLVQYRSPGWKAYFLKLYRELQATE